MLECGKDHKQPECLGCGRMDHDQKTRVEPNQQQSEKEKKKLSFFSFTVLRLNRVVVYLFVLWSTTITTT